jgi:8-oxo-dGTP pyrophosphatase MutT (NUDIX family)
LGYQVNTALRQAVTDRVEGFSAQNQSGEGLKHAAVGLVMVATEEGEGAIILTRRSSKLRAHKGQWALPGGRIDEGETPIEAVLRETHEEIDLHLPPENVIGLLDDYQTRSGYLITPVVVWAGVGAAMQANPDEVESIHLVSFSELNRPDSPVFLDIPESDRPVIRLLVEENFVHAPTAAVMYQFREVCLHGRHTRVDHFEQPVFAWK